jgi:hypothetical protein
MPFKGFLQLTRLEGTLGESPQLALERVLSCDTSLTRQRG